MVVITVGATIPPKRKRRPGGLRSIFDAVEDAKPICARLASCRRSTVRDRKQTTPRSRQAWTSSYRSCRPGRGARRRPQIPIPVRAERRDQQEDNKPNNDVPGSKTEDQRNGAEELERSGDVGKEGWQAARGIRRGDGSDIEDLAIAATQKDPG